MEKNFGEGILNMKKLEIWKFGDCQKQCDKLFALVKKGKKTATSYFGEAPMEKFSILSNWDGSEKLLIETTGFSVVKFSEVTKEHAKKEGEGLERCGAGAKFIGNFFEKC